MYDNENVEFKFSLLRRHLKVARGYCTLTGTLGVPQRYCAPPQVLYIFYGDSFFPSTEQLELLLRNDNLNKAGHNLKN